MKKLVILFILISAAFLGYLQWDKKQGEIASEQYLQKLKKEVQMKEQTLLLSETHPTLYEQIIQNGKRRDVLQNIRWGMTPKETSLRLVSLETYPPVGVRTEPRELIDYKDDKNRMFGFFNNSLVYVKIQAQGNYDALDNELKERYGAPTTNHTKAILNNVWNLDDTYIKWNISMLEIYSKAYYDFKNQSEKDAVKARAKNILN